MKKEEKIALGIAAFIGLVCLKFDVQISQAISSLRSSIPNWIFLGFTFEIQTFLVLFILTSLFLFHERKRKWILPLWACAALSVVMTYMIKVFIVRPRPYQAGVVSVLEIAVAMLGNSVNTWNFSFPSFQAVLAFSALPILDKEFKKIKYAWFAIAVLICFSRVYFGVHYASDVILGAVLGYFIGLSVVRLEAKTRLGENSWKAVKKLIK